MIGTKVIRKKEEVGERTKFMVLEMSRKDTETHRALLETDGVTFLTAGWRKTGAFRLTVSDICCLRISQLQRKDPARCKGSGQESCSGHGRSWEPGSTVQGSQPHDSLQPGPPSPRLLCGSSSFLVTQRFRPKARRERWKLRNKKKGK